MDLRAGGVVAFSADPQSCAGKLAVASDADGASATATVSITVAATGPAISVGSVSVAEGTRLAMRTTA